MAKVTIAAWLLQAPSKQNKVYGSAAWVDPSTSQARMYSAYGPSARLRSGTLTTIDDQDQRRQMRGPVASDVDSVATAFADRYTEKTTAATTPYRTALGGPATFTVEDAELADPAKFFKSFFGNLVQGTSETGTPMAVAMSAMSSNASTQPTVITPPPATAAPKVARSSSTGILLDNGESYYPRTVHGMLDVDLMRRARARLRLNILLSGKPGSGKTTLPVAAFGSDQVVVHSFSGDSRVSDIVGKFVPAQPHEQSDSGYVFRKGPLITAMEQGLVFVADEISRAPSEVAAALLPATDHRRTIQVDDLPGETITAADGFMVVSTMNPDGVGVNELDPALVRRHLKIDVPNDYNAAARRGVNANLIKVAKNLATKNAKALANDEFGNWAPSVATLLEAQKLVNDGLGDEIALGAIMSQVPDEDRDTVASVIQSVYGISASPLALGMSI